MIGDLQVGDLVQSQAGLAGIVAVYTLPKGPRDDATVLAFNGRHAKRVWVSFKCPINVLSLIARPRFRVGEMVAWRNRRYPVLEDAGGSKIILNRGAGPGSDLHAPRCFLALENLDLFVNGENDNARTNSDPERLQDGGNEAVAADAASSGVAADGNQSVPA